MSGKELVKRLRDAAFLAFDDGTNDYGTPVESADRIEALTAKVKLMDDLDVINGEKIEALTEQLKTVLDREAATTARYDAKTDELEAKLAKAVEALREIAGECGCSTARATLAEIEGSNAP
jgi:type II secretory pathway predicted ATPase ExeA